MAARRLTETARAAINKRADERTKLVDENFPLTYTIAFEKKHGRKPTAEELQIACDTYAGKTRTSAPPSAPIIKSAERRMESTVRTIVVKSMSELADAIAKAKVTPGIKVYMPGAEGPDEVDLDVAEQLLARYARESQGSEQVFETPAAAARAKFPTATVPMAGDGRGGDWPLRNTPYGRVEGNPFVQRLPGGVFVMSNADPGIAAPANFDAPEPGRNPADGPEAADLSKVSPVFKTADVPKGTFSNIIRQFGEEQR
jgi:hypothetical protein